MRGRDVGPVGAGGVGTEFVTLDPGEGVAYLAFQTSAGYQRPTWPNEPGRPQMQLHRYAAP